MDVVSGLNEKRRGLKKLFDYVVNGKVNIVVVSYKDRLTRFGFKYLEEFFRSHGVRIEVIFGKEPKNLQQELVEDLIAIVTSQNFYPLPDMWGKAKPKWAEDFKM